MTGPKTGGRSYITHIDTISGPGLLQNDFGCPIFSEILCGKEGVEF
jgi:hypothetical protein